MIPRCSRLFCRRPAVTSSAGRRFCVRHHPDHSRLVAEARRRLGEEYARLSVFAAALQQQEREAYEQWQADRQAAEQEAIDAAEAEQMYDAGEEPF